MKFLAVCLACVAISDAAKISAKRGIYGSQQADAAAYGHGGFDGGYQNNNFGEQHLSAPSFNSASLSSQPHNDFHPSHIDNSLESRARSNFNAASGHVQEYQNFPPASAPAPVYEPEQRHSSAQPNQEIVRAVHTHSIERVPQPIVVEKTIVKTVSVDRPVPQPIEVIKHVPQPYPVERIREVVREVKVPTPYIVQKEVVKPYTVDRIVPQPYPVVREVKVPVDRPVPVYIQHQPQVVESPVVHHQTQLLHAPIGPVGHATSYSAPQSYAVSHGSYGLPESYGAVSSYGSFASHSHTPLFAARHAW